MNRCPCCNARLDRAISCHRCQADLSLLINSEHAAKTWLAKAISYWLENNSKQSINALLLSLHLKQTNLAMLFRDYVIQQQCRDILDLLAKKQLLSAKSRLFKVRNLYRFSSQLQQLAMFTDYLLTRHHKQ